MSRSVALRGFDGQLFARTLEYAQWDADTLADFARLPRATVAAWLEGSATPDPVEFLQAARVLALSPCRGCGGSGWVDQADPRTALRLAKLRRDLRLPGGGRARPTELARRGPPLPPLVSFGSLTIDVRNRRVTRDGRHVDLAVREAEVLGELAREPGALCSGQVVGARIAPEVRGPAHLVSVVIGRLRKKLALLGVQGCIEASKSGGWRLVDPEAAGGRRSA